jgi:ATP-dependent Clp protease ATP-binding subunit ClpA
MDVETERRVELAKLFAKQRRHLETEPEHLLAVVLDIDEEARALHSRGLDPSELRERTEAAFAARPAIGGYRDGAESAPSPALERTLKRVAGNRWLPFVGKVSMLDALFLEPSVAKLVYALRRGADSRYIVERARALAIVLDHATIGIEHVLRALLDLPSFGETLERANGSVDSLRLFLDRLLSRPPSPGEGAPVIEIELRRVLFTGRFPDSDTAPMTIRQLCIGLAREDDCDRFWDAAGVSRARFLRAVYVPS